MTLLEQVRMELNAIRAEKWVAERKYQRQVRQDLKRNMEARDKYTRPYRKTSVAFTGIRPMPRGYQRRTYVQDFTNRQSQLAERILNELEKNRTGGN